MKPHRDQGKPGPDKDSRDQYKRHIDGDITVRGQIETHVPPDAAQQHNTERAEDKARAKKNYIVSIVTLVAIIIYAGITFWQGCTMRTALTIEQRPLLRIQPKTGSPTQMIIGQAMDTPLEFINTGKTPAKRMFAYMFVELVSADQSPHLIDPEKPGVEHRYWTFTSTGALFNGQSLEGIAKRTGPKPGNANESVDVPLTTTELEMVNKGDTYMAVYGLAFYWDLFGRKHWTTFCGWAAGRAPHGFAAQKCTEYNNIDGQ